MSLGLGDLEEVGDCPPGRVGGGSHRKWLPGVEAAPPRSASGLWWLGLSSPRAGSLLSPAPGLQLRVQRGVESWLVRGGILTPTKDVSRNSSENKSPLEISAIPP